MYQMFYLLVIILFLSVLTKVILRTKIIYEGVTDCNKGNAKLGRTQDVNKCARNEKRRAEGECNSAKERATKNSKLDDFAKLDTNSSDRRFVNDRVNATRSKLNSMADACRAFLPDVVSPTGASPKEDKRPMELTGKITTVDGTPKPSKPCPDPEPVVKLPDANVVASSITQLHVDTNTKYLDELTVKLNGILKDLEYPNINIGKIEKTTAGAMPIFILNGPPFKQNFSMTLPQGIDGKQGPRGPNGPNVGGPDGPMGIRGDNGIFATFPNK
jgi:hypothetical protein